MFQSLILYLKVHLKFWYIYIATIILIPIALFITLFFMRAYSVYFGDGYLFNLLTFSTFSICTTPLLLIPNYQAADRISGEKSTKKLIVLNIVVPVRIINPVLLYWVYD